jgi:integrase
MKLNELIKLYGPKVKGTHKYQLTAIRNLQKASEFMGNPELLEITTALVDDYSSYLGKSIKPSSINRAMTNLHSLLKFAHDRDLILKMPKFTWEREDNERVRWLSDQEQETLLKMVPEEFSAFCEILIHTGMRRGELLTLTKDNIDGDYIRLWKTKTGRARSVPLSAKAKELANQYVPFKLTESQCTYYWNKAKTEMGLQNDKDFVLHTLRHTTATRMLKRTGNIALVQRMLGHSKITTTMRYAHIEDNQLLQAVQ